MTIQRYLLTLALFAAASAPRIASACGCFAVTSTATPVVQAGEQILFYSEGDTVVGHIQIFYTGSADKFAWLLPMPSQPTLDVGDNAIFDALAKGTQPTFVLRRTNLCRVQAANGGGGLGCGADSAGARSNSDSDSVNGGPNIVVAQGTVGPYDYAILKADTRTDLTSWLNTNLYFVPTTQTDVISPYIHSGAYFVAIKLSPGKTVGDIKPLVVRYPSDLAMVPLILTSATSVDNLPVTVYFLGQARAVPRNYHHVVLDDAALDWFGGAKNYGDLVGRAVRESPTRRAFVTQYAGPSSAATGNPALSLLAATRPVLTRLYTILRPEDMTADPAFGWNPDLPMLPIRSSASSSVGCDGGGSLLTPAGFNVPLKSGLVPAGLADTLPAAQRVEILREAGPPEIVTDNTKTIQNALAAATPKTAPEGDGELSRRAAPHLPWALAMIPLALLALRRRRR